MDLDRRTFLRALGAGSVVVALRCARPQYASARTARNPDPGPLGPPDGLGIRLPEGGEFTSRELARAGALVAGSGHRWHPSPDGGATFPTEDGGWIYVSNSEVAVYGGVGALAFDPAGHLVDAYSILSNTSANCAGGPTPWGTWLSCEEHDRGRVWECDPTGRQPARPLDGLGRFFHEAAATNPLTGVVYMTEDRHDGLLYRWVPDRFTPGERADFDAGHLEAALVEPDGATQWLAVSAGPDGGDLRSRVEATKFARGEGAWFDRGLLRFCTTADARVWEFDPARDLMRVLHHGIGDSPLRGPDNITAAPGGWAAVAEDGGDMQVVIVTDAGAWPLLQVTGDHHAGSELAGVAFDPSGTRLYVSSQRGYGRGVTYEITGPFAESLGVESVTASTQPDIDSAPTTSPEPPATDSGIGVLTAGAGGAAAVGLLGALGAAAWKVRQRDGSVS